MIKTHISVTVGITHNLGDYSNTRPEVQISAQLMPQDDAVQCVMQLQNEAFDACCRQVDTVLENYGSPARFSREPRYSAYVSERERIIVFVADRRLEDPAYQERFKPYSSWHKGHRYAALQRIMHSQHSPEAWHYIDEDEGGLDSVPTLERINTYEAETCIIVVREPCTAPVPEYIRQHAQVTYHGHVNPDRFIADLEEKFLGRKLIFSYYSTDSDIKELENMIEFQELRERLAKQPPTQPDPEDDTTFDNDDYEEDFDEDDE